MSYDVVIRIRPAEMRRAVDVELPVTVLARDCLRTLLAAAAGTCRAATVREW